MVSKHGQLENLLAPVVKSFGCELWGLDFFSQGKRSLLRLYIEKPGGVSLEDCERVSRQVSSILDVEDPIAKGYTLEVSSPGMDRPLFNLEQYRAYIGSEISLRLRTPFEGRRKFTGVLHAIEDDEVVLQVGEDEYLLPFELIEKANVVPNF